MKKTKGSSIRLFLVDGLADGLRIVEKSNWTGQALACSRTQFTELKNRSEFSRIGVYVIYGYDSEDQLPMVYIGEGDPVIGRLESHNKSKDFWEHLILFTTTNDTLNKAHIQYLEARLVEMASAARRCKLENANKPARPTLSEPDANDMEVFLDDMKLIYGVLGLKVFDIPTELESQGKEHLQIRTGQGVLARGYENSEGFVVMKDSKCLRKEVPSFPKGSKNLRATLLKLGVVVEVGDFFVLTQDYVFSSPSQAADQVLGRSANGRMEWKTDDGVTLKELQTAKVKAA